MVVFREDSSEAFQLSASIEKDEMLLAMGTAHEPTCCEQTDPKRRSDITLGAKTTSQ